MLRDNVKIKTSKGAYKDFPYQKELYIYGTCVWTDDFPKDVPDEELADIFDAYACLGRERALALAKDESYWFVRNVEDTDVDNRGEK